MKYFLLLLMGLTTCACFNAMETPSQAAGPLTMPESHPRLFWTPERLIQAKNWYRTNSFTPTTNTESPNHIYDHVLQYVLTSDPAPCKTAIDWALAVRLPENEIAGTASDIARWNGEKLILTYDWCYDQWTPEQRREFIDRWNGYFSLLMTKQWGGPTMPTSNYFWGYLRNDLEWGIA